MTPPTAPRRIVLVPGHWLGGWAWDRVTAALQERGVDSVAVTLPGMDPSDPRRTSRALSDQAEHLLDIVEQAAEQSGAPVVLAAHSGANGPATLVLDWRPDLVSTMVWIDSGPVADGVAFAPDLPHDIREVPLPPFAELAQKASLAGLSEEELDRFRARAVPQPGNVMREPVALHNDERRAVPTVLVCCSFTGQQVLQLATAGNPMMAEVATLERATTVDLPTGHWPMWSRPADLAAILTEAANSDH